MKTLEKNDSQRNSPFEYWSRSFKGLDVKHKINLPFRGFTFLFWHSIQLFGLSYFVHILWIKQEQSTVSTCYSTNFLFLCIKMRLTMTDRLSTASLYSVSGCAEIFEISFLVVENSYAMNVYICFIHVLYMHLWIPKSQHYTTWFSQNAKHQHQHILRYS